MNFFHPSCVRTGATAPTSGPLGPAMYAYQEPAHPATMTPIITPNAMVGRVSPGEQRGSVSVSPTGLSRFRTIRWGFHGRELVWPRCAGHTARARGTMRKALHREKNH